MSIQLSIDHLVGINVMKKIIKFINIITFFFYCTLQSTPLRQTRLSLYKAN